MGVTLIVSIINGDANRPIPCSFVQFEAVNARIYLQPVGEESPERIELATGDSVLITVGDAVDEA